MENQEPSKKKPPRRNSNSHISISDNESTTSQVDSWHSPLRSDSPISSDDPYFHHENKSLVPFEKYYSPGPSPGKSNLPASSPADGVKGCRPWPHSEKPTSGKVDFPVIHAAAAAGGKGGRREKPVSERGNPPVVLGLNKLVRDQPPPGVKKVGTAGSGGRLEEGYGGEGEDQDAGEKQSRAAAADILSRSERSAAGNKAALLFRVFEVMVCLVSFSVMAADKTRGWSGDSFERYLEYRYCLVVNIIGFVYSGFQAYDMAYHLGTEKHVISHRLRYHFDFSMDQILAYLLMSASSSAATRVTDWISNWGKDEFTLMATASIAMSFLAFVAFALSSLISGYNFCNHHST